SAMTARRLAIARQRLAGEASKSTADGIFDVVMDLGFLQLDPTSVVAPSHQLVVFSRVGPYQPKHIETLLWDERRLFESWAHAASIVVTEHYPIYRWIMHRVATGKGFWHGFTASGERQSQRVLTWMTANDALRRSMLRQIRERGPLPSRAFEDRSTGAWQSSGWNNGRNVGMMLFYLQMTGQLMVAGRSGGQKLWNLPERVSAPGDPEDQARGAGDRSLGSRNLVARARGRNGRGYPRPLHQVEVCESSCGTEFLGEAGTNRAGQRSRRRPVMAGKLVRARGRPPASRPTRGRPVEPANHVAVPV